MTSEVQTRIHDRINELEQSVIEMDHAKVESTALVISTKLVTILPQVVEGEFTQAKLALTHMLRTARNEVIREILKGLVKDIELIEALDQELMDAYSKQSLKMTTINLRTGHSLDLFIDSATTQGLRVKSKSNSKTVKDLDYELISGADKVKLLAENIPLSDFVQGIIFLQTQTMNSPQNHSTKCHINWAMVSNHL